MIAAYILIQAKVGQAATVAAALQDVPGVAEAASVAGPYDVVARAQVQDIDELGRLVVSLVQVLDGVLRAIPARMPHPREPPQGRILWHVFGTAT